MGTDDVNAILLAMQHLSKENADLQKRLKRVETILVLHNLRAMTDPDR